MFLLQAWTGRTITYHPRSELQRFTMIVILILEKQVTIPGEILIAGSQQPNKKLVATFATYAAL